ncbi:MAG: WD40/YVTN/BNR-like repeat-containing protein [Bacteroidia bacterium]
MTGRISDLVIDIQDESHWYVGVASGGVWETKNAGVTFSPIFDGQKVYSIGCITLDPKSRDLWVGTGENVGGRHISFGDGIYLSQDGGKSWKNMGLKKSEHISKIIVHPDDRETIWVAVQGPLWSSGGERGVYMTSDGGKKWKRVLGDSEWTGATDLLIDPRNPDVLYAATWQRHRTVASYLGGGPKSGVHKSTDGGKTWKKLSGGLPGGNMGKIGLAISPQNPDVVYAAIELDLRTGGFFRSEDGGASWEKKSSIISGGTGPHYYQELYASPHQFDRVYFANNYLKVTNDGGANFQGVAKKYKHVDNHAIAFKKSDPDYLMVGTDGGLYESFDLAKNWRHMGNLPITQFYKIAIDDAKPFYNIYGGTQDNNTQGGVSQTDSKGGIGTENWKVVLGGDGHQPATEPGNPNIVYAQSQQGYYSRIDMKTGERVGIRPQAGEGEGHERYNWDAPILVSSHDPARLYVASQRLWRSDDRGDSWQALSSDLTKNEERFDLPIMGRKQSFENAWDVYAMSTYNTITSIAESPQNENIIYIGTDDGLLQSTKDGGGNWTSTKVGKLPGAPKGAYVNDIKADLYDENTVYVVLDAHKQGDYCPYIYKSTNGGKSWKSIIGNLPENHYIWRVVQDHVNPDLMFVGTEFGIFMTLSGGGEWVQLKGGLPTISFRDLAIHKGENDLVAASFGRGIYILDDYSFLREVDYETLQEDANLFSVSDAQVYVQRRDGRAGSGSLGGQHFVGKNPEFGASIQYYVKEQKESQKSERKKKEQELNKSKSDVDFPGWDVLAEEASEAKAQYYISIKDGDGNTVNRLKVAGGKGIHRTYWNLRTSATWPIHSGAKSYEKGNNGFFVVPGTYYAHLFKELEGEITWESEGQSFEVNALTEPTLREPSAEDKKKFLEDYMSAVSRREVINSKYRKLNKNASALEVAMRRASFDDEELVAEVFALKKLLAEMNVVMYGDKGKNKVGEKNDPTVNDRIGAAGSTIWGSTYGPTTTANQSLDIANKMMSEIETKLSSAQDMVTSIHSRLKEKGAPVILNLD